MPHRLLHTIPARRWVIAALLIILAVIFGEVALRQRHGPIDLGAQVAGAPGEQIVSRVQPAGLAWAAGIRPGDRVVALEGGDAGGQAPAALQSLTVKTAFGGQRTVAVTAPAAPPAPFRWAAFLVIAASFLVVGLGVFILSRPGSGAATLLAMSLSAALALLSAIATPTGAPWALAGVNAGLVGFATATLLLFLGLALPDLRPQPRRLLRGLCVAIAALLLAGYAASALGDGGWYDVYRPWLMGTLLVLLLSACLLPVVALARADGRRSDRVALQFAVLGLCGGVLPFSLLVLAPGALGWPLPLPPELPALALIMLPVCLGLAVLTRQWFGVERLARQGVVALAVWSLLLLGYGLLLDGLRHALPSGAGLAAALVHATTFQVALVAGSFPLAQHALRRWAERRIFHTGDAPALQLQRLQSALAQAHDLNRIAATSFHQLQAVLAPPAIRLTLVGQLGGRRRYHWPAGAEALGSATQSHATTATPARWRRFVLRAQGQVVGTLAIAHPGKDDAWPPDAAAVVAGMLPMLAVTLANALLLERLQQQVALLGEREQALAHLSAQLLQAQEDERRRIAFDLHDDPLQRTILLERAVADAPKTALTRRWRNAAAEIATSLRATCASLRPPMLDDLGLAPALAWLANDVRARSDMAVDLLLDPAVEEAPLAPDLAVALYRVTQEALNNCVKHADATQVSVALTCVGAQIQLCITDDGRGYRQDSGGQSRPGLGIAGMRERLRPLGGMLEVDQAAEGGTVVTATVPIQEGDHERSATAAALAHDHRG